LAKLVGVACLGGTLALALSSPAMSGAPNYRLETEIAGADGGWDFASVDPVQGRLYVARSNAVMSVDLATGAVADHLASADRGHDVVPLKNGQELLETDGNTGLARIIDTATGAVLAEIKTGAKPDAALFDAATDLVAVMNGGDGTVAVIDPAKRTLVGHVMVGGVLEFGASDGHGLIWINVEDKNELVAVDLARRTVTAMVRRALPLSRVEVG
jgi:DNA-binding beta-propeller fold protein YncE